MSAARLLALAALLALTAAACGGSSAPPPSPAAPETATESPAAPSPTTAATPSPAPATAAAEAEHEEPEYEIVTLLPPDAIPAINNPRIISAAEGDAQLRLSDLVIGVSVAGEHRAYGAAFLSGHEIVNDTLGGRAIAVTW